MSKMNVFSIIELRKQLQKELGCNFHAVPSVKKVVVSACCGKFMQDTKKMEQIKQQIRDITGRIPLETKARKSVASFKVRTGMHLGYKVTLRGKAAEDFLFMIIYMTLPRVTDFRGVSVKSFDGLGNYNIGIKDASVFMQINHDIETKFGMNITIVTDAKTNEDGLRLLHKMNVPFKDYSIHG